VPHAIANLPVLCDPERVKHRYRCKSAIFHKTPNHSTRLP
jgi:hypothetical protein